MKHLPPQPIILFGGPSEERKVSVASAQNILRCRPDWEPWFIHPDLQVARVSGEVLAGFQNSFVEDFSAAVRSASTPERSLEDALGEVGKRVVFIALHGTWGEDGALQEMLDRNGIVYTGAGRDSCSLAFDKHRAKQTLSQAGFLVPRTLYEGSLSQRNSAALVAKLFSEAGPMVIKPVAGGSSIGLHLVRNGVELERVTALPAAAFGEDNFLVETMVTGREITVGVWLKADGSVEVLPGSEIRIDREAAFDYAGKYLGKSVELTPAPLTAEESRVCAELSAAAHRLLGVRGCSRTDIILGPSGAVFLELNTHPGLSNMSFIPQQLRAANHDFGEFLDDMIEAAHRT